MRPVPASAPSPGLLARLGLGSPVKRAWALYDWAVSSFQTTITTAVFPIYWVAVAGAALPKERATQALANANTIALLVTALLSPILGAVIDYTATKKRWLAVFLAIGSAATAGLWFVERGDLALAFVLFVAANVAYGGTIVCYEALLPHVAGPGEMDRVSTAGYALGYVGGGLLLLANLLWIQQPAWFGLPTDSTVPARLAFVSVAVWWLAFSIPLLRTVPEPPRLLESDERAGRSPLVAPFSRLKETFQALRQYKQAALLLLAFLVYNDGIQTIIKMATAYGTEIGIERGTLIAAILLVQFVGIPFAFAFGALAQRIGAKTAVLLGLAAYAGISILGYQMRTGRDFLVLALLVGTVQGGTQALSRSLFASMIPLHKSGEFFGFWSVVEKFAGILGPVVFAVSIQLAGSSRNAILSVIAFFVVGGALLLFVDVPAGQAAARASELDVAPVPGEALDRAAATGHDARQS
jgi:UMF1 family MFS transporter